MRHATSRSHGRYPAGPLAEVLVALLCAACGGTGDPAPSDIRDPVFTDPVVKIQETEDLVGFSETLFAQYVHQEAALVDPTVSVYMAFFAGADQRGLALSFIDTTNYLGRPRSPHAVKARAIWIEGTGDWQYAAYRLTNETERWSERASQEDPTRTGTPLGNQVTIHDQTWTDPFPVTYAQYHECRTLRALVLSGDVDSFRCAKVSFPLYDVDDDWVECPPCPPLPQ